MPASELSVGGGGETKQRFSDTELIKNQSMDQVDGKEGNKIPIRRYHSKSLSLSENRVALGASNVFQHNRELWQQRTQGKSTQNLSSQRILTRNRIAPDLVMDLPSSLADAQNRASRESLDLESEDLTSAERFATQNQCTLKKNERFSHETDMKKEIKLDQKTGDKPKAEVRPNQESLVRVPTVEIHPEDIDSKDIELVLHIDEGESSGSDEKQFSKSLRDISKSPIPLHNTQKFASQFAGLHLTGGCLGKADSSTTSSLSQTQAASSLSSFKPQVKVKPQILKKPLVLPPTTPEMSRRTSNQD